MDFTREPIVESVITPKEGFKLIVRSSKKAATEEYHVDSLELVLFGHNLFFRSLDRTKPFLLPVTDYEVVEVKESRSVVKSASSDRAIKIAGGRKEAQVEKIEHPEPPPLVVATEETSEPKSETRTEKDKDKDKRRDKRRQPRKRRGEGVAEVEETEGKLETPGKEGEITPPAPRGTVPTILPPPSTLISETIARYRNNDLFSGAFYLKENKEDEENKEGEDKEGESQETSQIDSTLSSHPVEDLFEEIEMRSTILEPSEYGSLDVDSETPNADVMRFDDEEYTSPLHKPTEGKE